MLLMGRSTISMAMFNSFCKRLPEGDIHFHGIFHSKPTNFGIKIPSFPNVRSPGLGARVLADPPLRACAGAGVGGRGDLRGPPSAAACGG